MLDGAVGANEKSQAKRTEDHQNADEEAKNKNKLANLDFAELGKEFRERLYKAMKEKQEKLQQEVMERAEEGNKEAKVSRETAPEELGSRLKNEWP
jgi:hypothetical protein